MIEHMKVALATAALAFGASSVSALEDQLSKLDQSIVANMIGGVIVITKCSGYKYKEGGLIRMSERLGVDGDRLLAAIMAAVNVTNDLPYDRSALIPEVTRLVRDAADELSSALPQQCGKWAKTLIDNGVIEQK
jgi:hypothetical protein